MNALFRMCGCIYLDDLILNRIWFLWSILNFDFIKTRFSQFQLSPSACGHSHLNRFLSVLEYRSIVFFNRIRPIELPVFDDRLRLDLEELVDIHPLTLVFTNLRLELIIRFRGRFGRILVIRMKFNSQIKIGARKKSGSNIKVSGDFKKDGAWIQTYTSGGKIQACGSGQAPRRGNWPSGSAGREENVNWEPAKTVEEAAVKVRTVIKRPFIK